jgi:hypothetical protein
MVPSAPQLISGLSNVRALSACEDHALAMTMYQGVYLFWGWGANNDGQIGDGTTIDRSVPVLIHFPFDADGDGIPDWQEYQLGTNPLNPDQNHDGLLDGIDLMQGFNPASTASSPFNPSGTPTLPDTYVWPVITLTDPADAVQVP